MSAKELEILLVEDDPADAELTMLSLRREGLANNITIARDGAEALDFLFCRGKYSERRFEEPARLVLLDLKLPRVSGHDVLRQVKADERTRSIPVIVMTSSNHERDLEECYRLGANSYIQKPVDLHRFQETVSRLGVYWLAVNCSAPAGTLRHKEAGKA